MKYLVIVAFVAIIGSLAAALVFMMRSPQNNAESDEKNPGAWHALWRCEWDSRFCFLFLC